MGFLVLDWSCVGYLGVDARLSPLPSGSGHGDVTNIVMLTLLRSKSNLTQPSPSGGVGRRIEEAFTHMFRMTKGRS